MGTVLDGTLHLRLCRPWPWSNRDMMTSHRILGTNPSSHTALSCWPKLSHQPFRSFTGAPVVPCILSMPNTSYLPLGILLLVAATATRIGLEDKSEHPGLQLPSSAKVGGWGGWLKEGTSILSPMFEIKLMKQHRTIVFNGWIVAHPLKGKSLEAARSPPASPPMVPWNGAALKACPTSRLPGISQLFRTTYWSSKKGQRPGQIIAEPPLWVGTAFSLAWCQDTSSWRTTMRREARLLPGAWCLRSRETRATSTPLWKFRTVWWSSLFR